MVQLVPMTDDEYAAFLEHLIPDYAADQVRAGYWSESEALEKSRQQTAQLLPDGPRTKDHYLYAIRVPEHGQAVGVLWLRATPDAPLPAGFIFDLEVHEAFRRKGYAREAMLALETIARAMGLKQLGLHVFAYNHGARALYEELGYTVASLNMLKSFDRPAA